MPRYIDADDFEKFIKRKYKDGESTDDIKDQMLFDLSYQPTAYDVDAVIAGLKKESYQEWCDSPKIVELNDAIDIVRNAGKEGVE